MPLLIIPNQTYFPGVLLQTILQLTPYQNYIQSNDIQS